MATRRCDTEKRSGRNDSLRSFSNSDERAQIMEDFSGCGSFGMFLNVAPEFRHVTHTTEAMKQ
jgi:hypothetical protein